VKGFTKTYYYYQLIPFFLFYKNKKKNDFLNIFFKNCSKRIKFRDNKLSAFRIQTYGSANKSNITYSLEIHSIEKINKQPEKRPEPLKPEGKKIDWNF
jgi:hypothetical protein